MADELRPLVVNASQVAKLLGVGRASFYRILADGSFDLPKVKLSNRRVGYILTDVEEWVRRRLDVNSVSCGRPSKNTLNDD